ncbi:MAG: methyltransferase [Gammaproteobacteria bacterium RIFCSPLOWO2_02_FULL_42_14]|nr:MAG: methyltransferase [Gammaproteobacteria bacterium RIFCSPHIGHO2_02_FULL_42_43]OGT28546.1 MAG: methyltransferase [Gammaproteobacteria bacterium RIFCSPHIGHO2_01_FULL_42_8]OGT51398.1 MAG: methyltransferase [Gammaproteobacteria bacterium RIFCSPHIGHO2_12_FULL_41_25]OGT62100.1 MAG: methyltransferase [Gammaproteobacteria bacterium RIFCSPLOWO2_02_FULL_42_14]OGT85772.1 MAG: methyltransferase [Gammaproteobacteria bacterium RIFCSPLOWO2_12_FULL_42_18]
MPGKYYTRKTCRLCDSKHLIKVLSLTPTALCDEYLKRIQNQPVYPLDLFQCDVCQFVQIEYVVNSETIYGDYIYITTSSSGLSAHFASYANQVINKLQLQAGDKVVDIGSNDGTLLNYFQQNGFRVLGIEPCNKIAEQATTRGIETISTFFNFELAKKIKKEYGAADLITLNNVFANIDDLTDFTKGLEYLLAKNGVLVIESSYLLDMAKNMVFDFIYHEHLSYFSILPITHFFAKFELRLIRVEPVATKGGSLRYYFSRELSQHSIDQSVAIFTQIEIRENINADFFNRWMYKIEALKKSLIVELEKHKDKKIFAYGASATSTTLIYHFCLAKYIHCLLDDNPRKVGTYSPGIHIPVKQLNDVMLNEDSVVIILAWRFYEMIYEKLTNFGCTVIIPLPSIRVLTAIQPSKCV